MTYQCVANAKRQTLQTWTRLDNLPLMKWRFDEQNWLSPLSGALIAFNAQCHIVHILKRWDPKTVTNACYVLINSNNHDYLKLSKYLISSNSHARILNRCLISCQQVTWCISMCVWRIGSVRIICKAKPLHFWSTGCARGRLNLRCIVIVRWLLCCPTLLWCLNIVIALISFSAFIHHHSCRSAHASVLIWHNAGVISYNWLVLVHDTCISFVLSLTLHWCYCLFEYCNGYILLD